MAYNVRIPSEVVEVTIYVEHVIDTDSLQLEKLAIVKELDTDTEEVDHDEE